MIWKKVSKCKIYKALIISPTDKKSVVDVPFNNVHISFDKS